VFVVVGQRRVLVSLQPFPQPPNVIIVATVQLDNGDELPPDAV